MSWAFILVLSDKAGYMESDHIKLIYFYQMDGVVTWIYAVFLFIVCEKKKLKEANLSDKLQRHIVNNYEVIIFKSFEQSRSF